MAAAHVNDAEPPVCEKRSPVRVKTGTIRSAMREDVAHPESRRDVVLNQGVRGDNAGNATHGRSAEQAACHGIAQKLTVAASAWNAPRTSRTTNSRETENVYSAVAGGTEEIQPSQLLG
jgi:hypothetical protein